MEHVITWPEAIVLCAIVFGVAKILITLIKAEYDN